MPSHAPMSSAEGLAEPLRSRWSPSIFDAGHVLTTGELETLLHAAQWAPSWGNSQPWAFVVAARGSAAHEVLTAHLSGGNSGWVPRASVVLIAATRVAADPGDGTFKGASHACYDLGQAAAHLTLQAGAMGLHAHQFAGFDRDEVASLLGVPEQFLVLSGIALGRRGDPAEVPERDQQREQRERVRRPLGEFVHDQAWGTPWGPG